MGLYATGEECRNNSRKNKESEPNQKQYPVVDVTGDGSKVQCVKNNMLGPRINVNWKLSNRRWQG